MSRLRRLPIVLVVLSVLLSVVLLATSGSDDFNRADGGLGANWTDMAVGDTLAIVSNTARSVSANSSASFWNVGTWGNDQYSQVTFVAGAPSESKFVGLGVRASGTGSGAVGYFLITESTTGAFCGITELASLSFTTLQTCSSLPAIGSVLKLQITGTTITAYDDGASIATTSDGTITSGKPAIYAYGNTSGSGAPQMDDWSGDDAGGAAATCARTLLKVGCDDAAPWRFR